MENTKNNIDLIEILVKIKYDINLTPEEEKIYKKLDEDEIKIIIELIDSDSFLPDLQKIVDKLSLNKNISIYDKNRIMEQINQRKKNQIKLLIKKD